MPPATPAVTSRPHHHACTHTYANKKTHAAAPSATRPGGCRRSSHQPRSPPRTCPHPRPGAPPAQPECAAYHENISGWGQRRAPRGGTAGRRRGRTEWAPPCLHTCWTIPADTAGRSAGLSPIASCKYINHQLAHSLPESRGRVCLRAIIFDGNVGVRAVPLFIWLGNYHVVRSIPSSTNWPAHDGFVFARAPVSPSSPSSSACAAPPIRPPRAPVGWIVAARTARPAALWPPRRPR